MERGTVSVTEAARFLGIGRNLAYQAVRNGTIPSLRIGSRVLIPRNGLEALLEGFSVREERLPDPSTRVDLQP